MRYTEFLYLETAEFRQVGPLRGCNSCFRLMLGKGDRTANEYGLRRRHNIFSMQLY